MSKTFKYCLLMISSAFTAGFLILAFIRIRYPFELEWMEGGSAVQVARILAGGRLYVTPRADFVPYIYPPLYFYLSALVAKFTGVGFTPLRIVSLSASIGSIAMIFLFIKAETKDRFPAWIAACLFAATFHIGGVWMDIARADSLLVFLLLVSFYILRHRKGTRSLVASGAVLALAYLTKQNALLIALPVIILVTVTGPRRSWPFAVSALALSGAAHLALDRVHGGFYSYYTVTLPPHHTVVLKNLISFWTSDFALPLSIVAGLSILYFLVQKVKGRREAFLFYLCLAAGFIAGAWVVMIHKGSYANVLMPAHAACAILFGLGLHEARELVRGRVLCSYPFAGGFLYLLCIIQFASLAYDPIDQIPSHADRRAGEELIEMLSGIEGDVLISYHPYYAVMAGKQGCAHHMAIRDVICAGDSPERRALISDCEEKLRNRRYAAIVLDDDRSDFIECVRRHYFGLYTIAPDGDAFFPVTGVQLRPTWIWQAERPAR